MARQPKPTRAEKRQAEFDLRKAATKAAADQDKADKEALRKAMESGRKKPPAKLTGRELRLAKRMDDGDVATGDDTVRVPRRHRRPGQG